MLDYISVFSRAIGLARHAGARQGLATTNIANADTPGYRAKDIPDFSVDQAAATQPPRATRPGHVSTGFETTYRARAVATEAENPNGNTVSLEEEMVRSAEAEHKHDLAMTVYTKSLDLLRMSLGGRR